MSTWASWDMSFCDTLCPGKIGRPWGPSDQIQGDHWPTCFVPGPSAWTQQFIPLTWEAGRGSRSVTLASLKQKSNSGELFVQKLHLKWSGDPQGVEGKPGWCEQAWPRGSHRVGTQEPVL